MLISEVAEVIWGNRNKAWYISKGYTYTKNGDILLVQVEDLSPSSSSIIQIQCDYCGEVKDKPFNKYIEALNGSICKKDSCYKCSKYKIVEGKRLSLKSFYDSIEDKSRIPLGNNMYTLIDLDDFPLISQYRWCLSGSGYVVSYTWGKDKKAINLHNLVMGFPALEVDHINHIKTDNRKSNLRLATRQGNAINTPPFIIENKKSQYKGVSFHKQRKIWYARIKVKGISLNIGNFSNEVACANAYNYYAKELYGDYAFLNDIPYMDIDEWQQYMGRKRVQIDIDKYKKMIDL